MPQPLQPLIHRETVLLRAPVQAWSGADGSMGQAPIHGYYFSDTRLVSGCRVLVGDRPGEPLSTAPAGASTATFVALQRHLDDEQPDPRVRSTQTRTVGTTGVTERLVITSNLDVDIDTTVAVTLTADLTAMDRIKAGLASASPPDIAASLDGARWSSGSLLVRLSAPDASVSLPAPGEVRLDWAVRVPARGETAVEWSVSADDSSAVVRGVDAVPSWSTPIIRAADDRLARWVATALDDIAALRLTTAADTREVFLAAGAPWFFTLFGRDSIWAARMMLPLGTALAGSTLRVLAGLQGETEVADTAEQPGKIMHELRRDALEIPGEGVHLPPLYYGTVDATPLWVCLLHDAWRWGLPDDEVRALLPHLAAALAWMRDYGDADGDGLLEYTDESGHGLSNQGWKDSGDSVQWRDGRLAEGPIALCEVQAYAYEAAMHGADLLDHFGEPGAAEWRDWAGALRESFASAFWIDDPDGAYPAIALDARKRPVDTVTSNLGHLLGTGLLTPEEAALVARRLVSPELSSGFGLRTMSVDSDGYWPMSYHGGSVWTHDTAIAISGLAREGLATEAAHLTEGLLAAAEAFGYRMPELHSGDSSADSTVPIPYPAACRPQAWSATAAVSVLGSVLGLRADAPAGGLDVSPAASGLAPLAVSGLRFDGHETGVVVDASGAATVRIGGRAAPTPE
jgi:glycogen debranching enzyme